MPAHVVDSQFAQTLEDREVTDLVRRQLDVGRPQNEGVIALVPAPLQEGGGFGVGAGHDDAGYAHDVELEARGVQAFDLLVGGHQYLAALMAALLGPRLLVFDVVARHAHLDEAANQVAHVRIAAVAGVRIGDDEGTEVDFGGGGALGLAHARTGEALVAVGRQQGADHGRRLVRHLRERVARQVGARILRDRALGRGGPAAQIDPLDARSLQRHRLARGVGAKRGDLLACRGQFLQPRVELLGRDSSHRIVRLDRAALLHDLAGRVQPGNAVETLAGEPAGGLRHFGFERFHGLAPRWGCSGRVEVGIGGDASARRPS